MSDTNRGQVAFIAESSYGVQKTGSNLQILRVTSDNLAQTGNPVKSGEIRSNRRLANVRNTAKQVSGSLGFELSYGTLDVLLQAVLLSAAWTAPVPITASTISAAANDNSLNDSGNGLGGLSAYQWVYVSGFTGNAAGNNGFAKIATKAAGKITLTGKTLVDAVAGASVTIAQGGRIIDGTTLTTFNFERVYADLSQEVALFTGIGFNGLNLSAPETGIITGTLDCLGKGETCVTSSGGSGYTAITTTEPMQGSEINALLEGQSTLAFLSFTLALSNNLRVQRQAPSGISGLGTGQIDATGTVQAYFTSKTLYNKWLSETPTTLALALRDAAGNGYVLDFPQVKYTAGKRDLTGPSADVIANLNWTAYENTTESALVTVTRFPAQ
jgi:hypothetical protein